MRVTRTNSGPDSKGVVRFGRWEIEGEAYLFVVLGAIGAVLVFALASSFSLFVRLIFALLPLVLSVVWVKSFVIGKAPHYLGDRFECLLVGPHFGLKPRNWTRLRPPREQLRPEDFP
jgi:hypothetical protein